MQLHRIISLPGQSLTFQTAQVDGPQGFLFFFSFATFFLLLKTDNCKRDPSLKCALFFRLLILFPHLKLKLILGRCLERVKVVRLTRRPRRARQALEARSHFRYHLLGHSLLFLVRIYASCQRVLDWIHVFQRARRVGWAVSSRLRRRHLSWPLPLPGRGQSNAQLCYIYRDPPETHCRYQSDSPLAWEEYGEATVLRPGRGEEGPVDAGGGPHARLLHPGARPGQLARRAHQHRPDAVQQELPAAVDQLPPPGDQARQLHRPGGEAHRPPPGPPRQPVGGHRVLLAGADGQRHQELLEHAPQEEAQEDERHRHRRGRDQEQGHRAQGPVGAPAADGHPHRATSAPRHARAGHLATDDHRAAAGRGAGPVQGDVRVQRREHRAAAAGLDAARRRRGEGVLWWVAVLSVRPQRHGADAGGLDGDKQDGGRRRGPLCAGVLDAGELAVRRWHGPWGGGSHGRTIGRPQPVLLEGQREEKTEENKFVQFKLEERRQSCC